MAKGNGPRVMTQKNDDSIMISLPRQFTPDAVIHSVILTVGIVLVGAVMQSKLRVPALIPPSVSTHPALLMWSILLGAYAIFFLLCIMGVAAHSMWRLGELGRRGSYAALMMYSVQAHVTLEQTIITQAWFLRRSSRKFSTREITEIAENECGLTITTAGGTQETIWFSLYPPTVKKLKRELEQAIASFASRRS